MKSKMLKVGSLIGLIVCIACTQNSTEETLIPTPTETEIPQAEQQQVKIPRHNYGGWYCPDNLNGFPPVDIAEWRNVPVVPSHKPRDGHTDIVEVVNPVAVDVRDRVLRRKPVDERSDVSEVEDAEGLCDLFYRCSPASPFRC